jgi:hypothetical protein
MITTKRGKSGETKIAFNALTTVQTEPAKVPVMNLKEYATYRNEMAKAGNIAFDPMFSDPSVLGDGTDWQKELFRSTLLQKYGLGVSGGNDKSTFYLGTEYFDQQGVVQGSGFKRYSVRLNLDNQTRKWLKIGTSLSINQTREVVNTSNGDLLNIAIKQNPAVAVKNTDGSWGGPTTTQYQFSNPVALSKINDNHNKSMAFIGGIYADVTLVKGLVLHNDLNTYYQYTNNYIFNPSYEFNGYKNTTTVSTRRSGNNYWWGFNTRLQWFLYRLTKNNTRCLTLQWHFISVACNGASSIDRLPQSIDHTAHHSFTYFDRRYLTCAANLSTFLDLACFSH